MQRFVRLTLIFGKYGLLFLLVKLHVYKIKNEKFLKKFFEDAGGSFIKFGQLLALRVDILPKEYSREMMDLLDNVRPFPPHLINEIFLHEFGTTPEKIFKDFQKDPFASASFGQVHAAKLDDDTIVAVKIMRPDIEDMVAIDFVFVDILAFLADTFIKMKALSWRGFAEEFKQWTRQELDYHIEAEHAERMYQSYKETDSVVIPRIYHQLSTKRVLVQDYIEGIHLSRVLRGLKDGRLTPDSLLKMGVNIKETPHTLTYELLRQYFFFGFFHADLHPGNIILLPKGKIGLIDFGIVGEPLPGNQQSLIRLLSSIGDFNFKEATYYMSDLVGDDLKEMIQSAFPASVDQKRIDDFMRLITDHFSDNVEKTVNKNIPGLRELKRDYTLMLLELFRNAERYKIKVPQEMAIFLKAISTLGLLSKEMDKQYYIHHEFKKFFADNPEQSLPVRHTGKIIKRMSRERALEKFNNWLAYLMEIDPGIYKLVNSYIRQYNLVAYG